MQYNKFFERSGGRGLANLFTAVENHVATSPSARSDMTTAVNKFPCHLLPDRTTNNVLSSAIYPRFLVDATCILLNAKLNLVEVIGRSSYVTMHSL